VSASDDLARLREAIDRVDAQLVSLLGARFELTRLVGELKAASDLPVKDPSREAAQIARLRALADENLVDPDLVESLFKQLFAHVVAEHEAVRH
jgi:chorismate mutase